MKAETVFRKNEVLPFLKTLKNTFFMPIQQIGFSGDPDYVLSIGGLFVALELKSGDNEPRALQQYKGDEIIRTGGLYLVARPSNWQQTKLILTQLDCKEYTWK